MKFLLPLALVWILPMPVWSDELAGKIRVLVVTGGHDFERAAFFDLFHKLPVLEVSEAQQGQTATAFERGDLLDFDAIVLFDMMREITDEQKAAFVKLTDRGIGLVVMHHALVSYQGWPDYERIIGGRYPEKPDRSGQVSEEIGYRHDVDMPISVVADDHPITRGMRDFTIHDEIYWGFRVSPEAEPLLTTTHPDSGNPIAWAHEANKSRVVTIQPGHGPTVYANPTYRELVGRSIAWVARR